MLMLSVGVAGASNQRFFVLLSVPVLLTCDYLADGSVAGPVT